MTAQRDDHHTKARIVEELEWTADVNADRIGVAVNEGGVTLASAAFAHTIAVPPGSVTATVHDQVITLAGSVHWQYQREAAHRTVASLPGVREVHNTITLEPAVVVSAQDAMSSITAAIVRNARLGAQHVHVGVTGSTVTLTGTVASSQERGEAGQTAWFSPGVTHVDNQLAVAPVTGHVARAR